MNPDWDAESRPENKKKEHLVSGVLISPYRAYTNLMQGVSERESVVFLGPPPKTSLYIQKVFDCKWY
jgi:hypothetical protein